MTKKSQTSQLLLTIFFGPLGVFYSNVTGAIILLGCIVIFGITFPPLAFIIWVFSICAGISGVSQHNLKVKTEKQQIDKKLKIEQQRHAELIEAIAKNNSNIDVNTLIDTTPEVINVPMKTKSQVSAGTMVIISTLLIGFLILLNSH